MSLKRNLLKKPLPTPNTLTKTPGNSIKHILPTQQTTAPDSQMSWIIADSFFHRRGMPTSGRTSHDRAFSLSRYCPKQLLYNNEVLVWCSAYQHHCHVHVVGYQLLYACLAQLINAREHQQLHPARHAAESFRQSTARTLPVELLLPHLKPCAANASPVSNCTWTKCCPLVCFLAISSDACTVVRALSY